MSRLPPAKKPRITPRKDAAKRATNKDVSPSSESDMDPVIIEERHTPRQRANIDPRTLSMEEQVKIYRSWRRNGSGHEDTCFVCRKASGLVNCNTCRLAYHKTCLAADACTYEDQDRWYCPICVSRNWHIFPPSPPASPLLAPATASTSASDVVREPVYRRILRPPPTAHAETRPPSRPPMLVPALSALPTSTALPSSPLRSGGQPLGQATTQPRKGGRSRYSTLRPDVESAISTIYGELELSRSLSGDVARLQQDLEAARREIEVLRKELTVTRREAEMARYSAEAYDQLWQENERYKERDQGRGSLQEKVEELTTELNAAKEAIVSKDAMLDEWKTKLKGLLGEGT
ncbi:hypothetical protein LTR10_018298 [Elasticomyces elasticus]|uniref:PHD-type domain-containing protein n=1 Tax=Exophiala sideris TaxID=1016849 RepID=A0ABR0JM86_9EURO|nr:hypothetical protein LTR10_018298 [Elasticomyces elasticus]KAK5036688.1 hypothetical protein LTS07_002416 [Exophiala sideris]KAK5067072.1 hypothetical protein LTR69_002421 [Exophiala sideris]KAK5185130.1 hypothetical protein LTR44_002977 [Eurotiomycetes sp. CCFEE 6388]